MEKLEKELTKEQEVQRREVDSHVLCRIQRSKADGSLLLQSFKCVMGWGGADVGRAALEQARTVDHTGCQMIDMLD